MPQVHTFLAVSFIFPTYDSPTCSPQMRRVFLGNAKCDGRASCMGCSWLRQHRGLPGASGEVCFLCIGSQQAADTDCVGKQRGKPIEMYDDEVHFICFQQKEKKWRADRQMFHKTWPQKTAQLPSPNLLEICDCFNG